MSDAEEWTRRPDLWCSQTQSRHMLESMGMKTNAGFRPDELTRRRFQTVAAVTMDKQAEAIQVTREVLADVSVRLDNLERRQRSFEQLPFFARLRWLLRGR